MIYTKEMIKEENEKTLKRRRIRRIVLLPVISLFVLLLLYVGYHKVVLKDNNISILGMRQYIIMTGSMSPHYEVGDLIWIRKTSPTKIETDDVITYLAGTGDTVTHRVVEVVSQNGSMYYRTKGDHNNTADTDLVPYSMVQGKVFLRLPQAGKMIYSFVTGIGSVIVFALIFISYFKSVREEERMIAREDARKKFNVCKYKKETVTNDNN